MIASQSLSLLLLVLLLIVAHRTALCELTREELRDYLRYKQETGSTFDTRVRPSMNPIGSVAGKPIWPRAMQRVKSLGRVFLDDDGFAYETNDRNVVDLLHRMDREENFERTMQFFDRLTLEEPRM